MSGSIRAERVLSHTLLVIFSAVAIIPIFILIPVAADGSASPAVGLQWPAEWSFENFVSAWEIGDLGSALLASVTIAIASVIPSVILASGAGFAIAQVPFRGKGILYAGFIAGLVIPVEAIILPLYYDMRALAPGLSGTHTAVVLAQIGLNMAFGVFWMKNAFGAIPKSLFEVARIDGASTIRSFVSVALPLVMPSMVALAVLNFLASWNAFLLPLVMLAGSPEAATAPVALLSFQSKYETDVKQLAAAALLVCLPIIVFYTIFQKRIIAGALNGAFR